MQSHHEIGSLVLYEGDEGAKAFYKSEASYAELLAVKRDKAVLNLLLLDMIITVPKDLIHSLSVHPEKKYELKSLMRFFNEVSKKLYGSVPPIRQQKKCLRALIQSFELMENRLTREQALKIVMRMVRLN